MKLKTVYPELQNTIESLHKERIKLAYEISLKAIELFYKAYEQYKKDFKYSVLSPFTFKPVDLNTFESGLFGGGGIYSTKNKVVVDVIHEFNSEIEKVKYIYAFWYKTCYELEDEKEQKFIKNADTVGTEVFDDTNDDLVFYKTYQLMKELGDIQFENSDIERIARWEREIDIMKNILSDYGK